jgi:hypothetical protein
MSVLRGQRPDARRSLSNVGWLDRVFAFSRRQEADAMPVADPVAHHYDVDSVERCPCFSEAGPPSKCELLAMSFLAMGL